MASETNYVSIFGGQKLIKYVQKWSIWASFLKPDACSQLVLPDMSL